MGFVRHGHAYTNITQERIPQGPPVGGFFIGETIMTKEALPPDRRRSVRWAMWLRPHEKELFDAAADKLHVNLAELGRAALLEKSAAVLQSDGPEEFINIQRSAALAIRHLLDVTDYGGTGSP